MSIHGANLTFLRARSYVYSPNNITYCAHRCDPYDPAQLELTGLLSEAAGQRSCSERGPEYVPFRMTCNSGGFISSDPTTYVTHIFSSGLGLPIYVYMYM